MTHTDQFGNEVRSCGGCGDEYGVHRDDCPSCGEKAGG